MSLLDFTFLAATAFVFAGSWLVFSSMPRRGTLGQGVVVALYRWARFWCAVANAADEAVVGYHRMKREAVIEPVCLGLRKAEAVAPPRPSCMAEEA